MRRPPRSIRIVKKEAGGRAIVTRNRKHVVQLHAKQPSHAGIVACTFDPDFEGQAQRIHDALKSIPQQLGATAQTWAVMACFAKQLTIW
jgi:hypothetical protein